jgi:O-antigen ligase
MSRGVAGAGGGGSSRLAGAAWPVALGSAALIFGLLTLRLGNLDLRWVVYPMVGSVLAIVTMLAGTDRALMAYTVVGLSVDAHYYLTTPLAALSTGITSPGAVYVPLTVVPGTILLVRHLMRMPAGANRFRWGAAVSGPFGLMMATSLISIALTDMRYTGICVVWQLLMLFAVFLVIANSVDSEADGRRIVGLLLVALLGQALLFFVQLTTGIKFDAVGKVTVAQGTIWHGVTGTAASTTAGFATFMDPLVMLAFALYRAGDPRWRRVGRYVFPIGLTVVTLTLNRSSWGALVLGIIVTEAVLRRRRIVALTPGSNRRFVIAGVVLLVVFALAAPLFESARHAKNDEDFWLRIALMGPAIKMIKAHPILGVGPGVYGYVLRQYAVGYQGWLYIVHNDYLLVWAERGTLGFVAYLLWIRGVWKVFSHATRWGDRWWAAVACGCLGGFAAHSWEIFWTSGMSYPAYGVIWLMAGLCVAMDEVLRMRAAAAAGALEPVAL